MRLMRLAATGVALVALSCGNGDGNSAGDGAGNGDRGDEGSSAASWAETVCVAQTQFLTEVAGADEQYRADLAASGADLVGQKDALLRFLDTTIGAIDKYSAQLKDAGTPDVDGGGEVADAVVGSVSTTQEVIVQARSVAEGLSTADPAAFGMAVDGISTTIGMGFAEQGGPSAAIASNPELNEAVATEPACGGTPSS